MGMTNEQAKAILRKTMKDRKMDSDLRGAIETTMVMLEATDDIRYDYERQSKMMRSMIQHYKTGKKPVKRGEFWVCPTCEHRIRETHDYCHWCGQRLGENGVYYKPVIYGGEYR